MISLTNDQNKQRSHHEWSTAQAYPCEEIWYLVQGSSHHRRRRNDAKCLTCFYRCLTFVSWKNLLFCLWGDFCGRISRVLYWVSMVLFCILADLLVIFSLESLVCCYIVVSEPGCLKGFVACWGGLSEEGEVLFVGGWLCQALWVFCTWWTIYLPLSQTKESSSLYK